MKELFVHPLAQLIIHALVRRASLERTAIKQQAKLILYGHGFDLIEFWKFVLYYQTKNFTTQNTIIDKKNFIALVIL